MLNLTSFIFFYLSLSFLDAYTNFRCRTIQIAVVDYIKSSQEIYWSFVILLKPPIIMRAFSDHGCGGRRCDSCELYWTQIASDNIHNTHAESLMRIPRF